MEKKTKIVCTLGPACDSEDILRDMLTSGMNVARMNFSHGSHEEHKARLERFRKVCSELDIPAAAILDTKGPEIRLDLVEEGTELLKGNEFVLSCGPSKTGNSKKCSISYVNLYRQVKEGDRILIDDGKITLTVKGTPRSPFALLTARILRLVSLAKNSLNQFLIPAISLSVLLGSVVSKWSLMAI